MSWDLEILIDEPFQDQVQEEWLRQAVETTLAAEEIGSPAQLSLLITDNETVHALNRTYRGFDKTTDVLAFAFQDDLESSSFPPPPDGVTHLGEVIISYPQAASQAKEQGHPPKDEILLLVIHGVLHLLGYDHEQPEQEQKMRAVETKILATLRAG